MITVSTGVDGEDEAANDSDMMKAFPESQHKLVANCS